MASHILERCQPRLAHRLLDQCLLRRPMRRGQPAAAAILVDSAACHQGEERLTGGLLLKRLEHSRNIALAAPITICFGGKRLAAAIRRQRVHLRRQSG